MAPTPKAQRTKPYKYSDELGERICRRLAGGESLKAICRDADMPCFQDVHEWVRDLPAFRAQYAIAREVGYLLLGDGLLEIADDSTNDWMECRSDDGARAWRENGETVQRARLRLDTRKWILAKMLPKIYGDKMQHANAAGDGNQVTEVVYRWAGPEKNTPATE